MTKVVGFFYAIKPPQIPKPIIKYNPAKTKNTFPAFGLFSFTAKPIMVNKIGGPNIIRTRMATNPSKFPTSSAIIFLEFNFVS